MNLLEHYIEEVHSVTPDENNPDWVVVDVTCDCWGSIERKVHNTTKKAWEQEKEQGYFLA